MYKNDLSELQLKLLSMMKWFDRYCRENNLRYYVLGGTLLGAIRHQGFIPWDDDIDIGMPRKDYQRLAKLLENKKIDKYVLETVNSNNWDYCYPITKLYDTTTTLVENKRYPLVRGIFLDIFPLDGLGNNQKESEVVFSKIQRKYNFYLSRVGGVRKGRSIYKNCAVVLSRLIPNYLIDDRNLRIKIDEMCSRYDYDNSEFVANILGAWRLKEIVPREMIGKPTEYQFEDMKVLGIEDFDGYLTHVYGDWKKLPPKEKQVTHHDFLECLTEKSYFKHRKGSM